MLHFKIKKDDSLVSLSYSFLLDFLVCILQNILIFEDLFIIFNFLFNYHLHIHGCLNFFDHLASCQAQPQPQLKVSRATIALITHLSKIQPPTTKNSQLKFCITCHQNFIVQHLPFLFLQIFKFGFLAYSWHVYDTFTTCL